MSRLACVTMKSEYNRVNIQVWKWKYTKKSVGDVALQTFGPDGIYASFWPGICESTDYCGDKKIDHFHTRDQDDRFYGDQDLLVTNIDLYTLNVADINNTFKKAFKALGCQWALTGSSFLRKSNQRNCSGLALYLLEKGGIDKILPYYRFDEKRGGSWKISRCWSARFTGSSFSERSWIIDRWPWRPWRN